MSANHAAKAAHARSTTVLWFRNDLRSSELSLPHRATTNTVWFARLPTTGLDDNPLFAHAAFAKATHVLPVFCLDPRNFATTRWGSPKTGPFRAQFLAESVVDLHRALESKGSGLVIAHGKPELVLPFLVGTQPADAQVSVVYQAETCSEEKEVEARVAQGLKALEAKRALGVEVHRVWGHTLYHPQDLPFALSDLPEPFTKMRNSLERVVSIRKPVNAPDVVPPLPAEAGALLSHGGVLEPDATAILAALKIAPPPRDARSVLEFRGGETEAKQRLEEFCSIGLSTYKDTRNDLHGASSSSKLSPWLAHGCLSPRRIAERLERHDKLHGGQTVHTYWVLFELMWRDFFRFYCHKHGNRVFFLTGPARQSHPWKSDERLATAWKEGKTGVPFVDANMRELAATGFMSNRGRQVVASFLVNNLKVDWRVGADHFESLLIDHDVCSNYGNWVFAAGVGMKGQRLNVFNVAHQVEQFDAGGAYAKLWLPELRNVPGPRVHHLDAVSKAEQRHYGCVVGEHYPRSVDTRSRPAASPTKRGRVQGAGNPKKARRHKGRSQDFFTS